MIKEIENIDKYNIFKYFSEISAIPRGSGNTKAISNYLVDFAKAHNLEYINDSLGNVIIIKEAHPSLLDSQSIILQGHMDMVCEKLSDSSHNFETQGLDLDIDGDYLYANGTTLGGDDGIALAYGLALLADNELKLPRLECIFTIDEETGMDGAFAIDLSPCHSKYMINLDSESEGIFFAGCAGGTVLEAILPLTRINVTGSLVTLKISGLKGGHSGDEIDKGRGNANIIMGRLLYQLMKDKKDLKLVSFEGGDKHNAITREASISICLENEADYLGLIMKIKKFVSTVLNELTAADKAFSISIDKSEVLNHSAINPELLPSICMMTYGIPNGVIAMSQDIANLVETSTNLGVVASSDMELSATYLARSSVDSCMEELLQRMELILSSAGAKSERINPYPGWKYNPNSKLREAMVESWTKAFGKRPEVKAIHAGLECGILLSKKEDLDIVSLGPDIFDIHTPQEKLSISSSIRVFEFLLDFLQNGIYF